jgi:hypothetical protein
MDPATPPGCLGEAELRRLLTDEGQEDGAAARHLEECGSCRARLEALAGAASIAPEGRIDAPGEDTPGLARAMNALRDAAPGEAQAAGDSGLMAFLEPCDRPGFLGSFAGHDVVEVIASGGMGVVFKAWDRSLQRAVAIKVLAPALASTERARARFLREARAAAAVTHEHVVAIHAVGEDQGLPYLVMQFVSGRSLQARLDSGGPLRLAEMLRIGSQAAYGLAAAHAQGLIHRDIKPGNILLENSVERVKLTDFGLARAADEPGVTLPGVVAGTPEYMAPEQARGERLDARADLFSLGCVLYAMATGVSPFRANSVPATLKKVCDESPPRARELNPETPRWLDALIARLMAKEPGERMGSALALARLLEDALAQLQFGRPPEDMVIQGEEREPTPPAAAVARPKRGGAIAVAAVALAMALAFFFRPRPEAREDEAPFVVIGTDGTSTAYTNFDAAVNAVGEEDALELNWDGPRVLASLVLSNRPLTLRAGAGWSPVIVSAEAEEPWLVTDSPLRLEGLEIRSRGADSDLAAPGRLMGPRSAAETRRIQEEREKAFEPVGQLIVARGAPVRMAHCRLVGESLMDVGRQPVLLLDCPEAEFENCEVFHLGGAAIGWRLTEAARPDGGAALLRLTNSIVMSRGLTHTDLGNNPARVEISDSVFLGAFFLAAPNPEGLENLTGQGTRTVFAMRRAVMTTPGLPPGFRGHWSGQSNIYARPPGLSVGDLPPMEAGSVAVTLGLPDRIRDDDGKRRRLIAEDFALTAEELELAGFRAGPRADAVGPSAYRRQRPEE